MLYIPDLFVNLISSSTCQRDGITINTADCFLRTRDKTKLAHFFIQKGLYRLNEPNDLRTTLSLIGSDHNSRRWHERLGHLNFADMRRLGLPANPFDCKTCAISKRHKSFNRGPQQRATAAGELVHIDVIYLTPVGIKGFKYAITFTDDYTRWMEVRFLRSKEARSVQDVVENYIAWSEKQLGPLKRVQSDNGELDSWLTKNWFTSRGIKLEFSCANSPEQNGVAERNQRTLTTKARCLRIYGHLPRNLWPELIRTAAYLRNRSPSAPLSHLTPYEKRYGSKPSLDHLRTISSTVYCYKKPVQSNKLGPRAKKFTLIGFEGNSIYRVWDSQSQQVHRVKDITIFKTIEAQDIPFQGENEQQGEYDTDPQGGNYQFTSHPHPTSTSPLPQELHEESTSRDPEPTTQNLISEPPLQQSGRETHASQALQESIKSEALLDEILSNYVAINSLSSAEHDHFKIYKGHVWQPDQILLNASSIHDPLEPATLKEALSGPHAKQWLEAMQDELKSLLQNKTWRSVQRSSVNSSHKVLKGK